MEKIPAMKCSVCKTELVPDKMLKLETLDEHVMCSEISEKQSFICPNMDCEARINGVIWNEDGDAYHTLGKNIKFVDNNNGAFGSFARQMEVEIYRHDRKHLFTVKGWKFELEYHYNADMDGNVLKTHRQIKIIKPDGTLYISGIRMMLYEIKHIYRDYKDEFGNGKQHLKDCIERATWPRAEWWRKIAAKLAKFTLWLKGPVVDK